MKRFACVVCALAILWPSLLFAAEPEPQNGFFSVEHRWDIYDKSKKNSGTAVLYTLAFPGVGNLYAEQYFVGAAFIALGVFSAVFLTFGLVTDQNDLITLGGVSLGATYVASGVTAAFAAQDYNDELKRALKLPSERAALRSRGLMVTFAF